MRKNAFLTFKTSVNQENVVMWWCVVLYATEKQETKGWGFFWARVVQHTKEECVGSVLVVAVCGGDRRW